VTYEALLLALAAAFFPFGLVVFTLLVAREPCKARALGFLLGAIAMTFGSGIAFIALARDLDLAGIAGARQASGELDIAIGVLVLAIGTYLLLRGAARVSGR
jgi:tellurite resistance protein TehA-like permease